MVSVPVSGAGAPCAAKLPSNEPAPLAELPPVAPASTSTNVLPVPAVNPDAENDPLAA